MASQPAPLLLAELAAHSLQFVLVDAGGRLVGHRRSALDANAVAAALAELSPGVPVTHASALLIPSAGFVLRANADEAASIRTPKSLLARSETVASALTPPLNVVAFDSATGLPVDTVGATSWVLAGTPSARIDAAKAQLAALGLPVTGVTLALPVRIGAVAAALQDMPESTRVLVWQVSETDAQLACVSAAGCEAAGEAAAGFSQIFEAVQAGLGLKFRAAAAKLFFNSDYDFSETAGAIAERLAAVLRPAIAALGCAPTTLHVAGLPHGQAWLAKAVASALDLAPLSPDMAAFCAQLGLAGDAVNAELPESALSLLFQVSVRAGGEKNWQPLWLDAPASIAAPAPAAKAAPAPAPVPSPAPAPAATAPVAAKPSPVTPKPAAAPAPALASVPAKPTPVPAAAALKPAAKTAASAVAVATPKPMTPAPVLKPAAVAPAPAPVKKPEPAPVLFKEAVEEVVEAPVQAPANLAPKKKAPVMLLAAIGAVVVFGGAGAFFMMPGKTETKPAVVPAQVSETELRAQEEAKARMLADELKIPRSFRNERYSFEVSDRGVLQKLVGAGNRTIIDEFGWLELQGTFTGTAKPFYAGTIGDRDYVPSINKTVRDGKVVFEITGQHPRFAMQTLVTCLPTSLRIETVFKPINLEEPRGPISGVYTVKMNRQSLSLGQRAVVAPGSVSFSTQSGPVAMKFNGDAWGQAGEAGKQTFAVASNLVFFYFAGGSDPMNNVLTTVLTLP